MRRPLRVAGLVALLVFATLVLATPGVVESSMGTVDPERCQGRVFSVGEWAREPSEINRSREHAATYENLTSEQQTLFDRGRTNLTRRFALDASQFETADSLPMLVVANDVVYRAQVRYDRCPLVSFLPPAMNPAIRFLLAVNSLVTGPLAPVIVVVGGVALAFRLGRLLEY